MTGAFSPRSALLPWVLFGITAGVLAALTLVLVRSASNERQRADVEAQAHANEIAHAEKAELALSEEKANVAPLEEQVRALTAERDALAVKLGAGEGSKPVAVAAPPPAKVEPKKAPVKKTAKKTVKKKRR